MSAIYGMPEALVADAARYEDRAARRADARGRFVEHRERELLSLLRSAPSARIDSVWSRAERPTVAEELVAWVGETHDDPDAVLAPALFYASALDELVERFCCAYAQEEASTLADDYFDDMAGRAA